MRKRRVFLWGFLAIFLLAIGAAGWFLATFDLNDYREALETQIKEATGRSVSLGHATLSLSRGLAFDFGPIEIGRREEAAPYLTAQNAHFVLNLLPLLEGEVSFRAIHIDTPFVQATLQPPAEEPHKKSTPEAAALEAQNLNEVFESLHIYHLRIQDGEFLLLDDRSGDLSPYFELEAFDLELSSNPGSEPVSAKLTTRINQPDGQALVAVNAILERPWKGVDWQTWQVRMNAEVRSFDPGPALAKVADWLPLRAKAFDLDAALEGSWEKGFSLSAEATGEEAAFELAEQLSPLVVEHVKASTRWTPGGFPADSPLALDITGEATVRWDDVLPEEFPGLSLEGTVPLRVGLAVDDDLVELDAEGDLTGASLRMPPLRDKALGEPASAAAKISVTDDEVSITGGRVALGKARLEVEGEVGLDEPIPYKFQATVPEQKAATLLALMPGEKRFDLSGTVSGLGSVKGVEGEDVDLSGEFKLVGGAFWESSRRLTFTGVDADVGLRPDALEVRKLSFAWKEQPVELSGTAKIGAPGELLLEEGLLRVGESSGELVSVRFSGAASLAEPYRVKAKVDAERCDVDALRGLLDGEGEGGDTEPPSEMPVGKDTPSPAADLSVELAVSAKYLLVEETPVEAFRGTLSYEQNRLRFEELEGRLPRQELSVSNGRGGVTLALPALERIELEALVDETPVAIVAGRVALPEAPTTPDKPLELVFSAGELRRGEHRLADVAGRLYHGQGRTKVDGLRLTLGDPPLALTEGVVTLDRSADSLTRFAAEGTLSFGRFKGVGALYEGTGESAKAGSKDGTTGRLVLSEFSLETEKSRVKGSGSLRELEGPTGRFDLKATTINVGEVLWIRRTLFPSDEEPQHKEEARAFLDRLGAITLEDFQADIGVDGDAIHINPLRFKAFSGRLEGDISYAPDQEPLAALQISGKASEMDAQSISELLTGGKTSITGTTQAEFSITHHLKDVGESAARTANLHLVLRNGEFEKSDMMLDLLTLIDVGQIFSFKLPDLRQETFPYKRMEARVTVNDDLLELEEGLLNSDVMDVSAVLEFDLESEAVSGDIAVKPLKRSGELVSKIPLVGWVLTGDEKEIYTMHFNVTGKLGATEVKATPAHSLSEKTKGIFSRTLQLPGRIVDDIGDEVTE